jgi:hypothetical protein
VSDLDDYIIYFSAIAIFLVAVAGFAWFMASQEARSYRKFCDTPVTTWDAMFLDLRIDECRQPRNSKER